MARSEGSETGIRWTQRDEGANGLRKQDML